MQTFSAIGTFVVPPLILAYLFSQKPSTYLALDKKPARFSYLIVFVIMVMATPFINYLGELNSNLHLPGFLKSVEDWIKASEELAAKITHAFLDNQSPGDVVINILMIALIPAIGEELLFRGIIQKFFHQWSKNAHVAVWVTAIFFSAFHMQFYGFLPRMVLGGMLGYMLVWSGSLWLPIVAHFINNAAAVLLLYMYQNGSISIDPDEIGATNGSGLVVISFLLTIVHMFYLKLKNERANTMRPE
jgi:membrane protease YdiL (CAAX protease family)